MKRVRIREVEGTEVQRSVNGHLNIQVSRLHLRSTILGLLSVARILGLFFSTVGRTVGGNTVSLHETLISFSSIVK